MGNYTQAHTPICTFTTQSLSFGPEKGAGGRLGKSHDQLILDLMESHTLANWVKTDEYEACREQEQEQEVLMPPLVNEEKSGVDETSPYFDPHCSECRVQYKDPPPDTLVMYLHAIK